MAQRTTSAAVQAILGLLYDPNQAPTLVAHMTTATALVDWVVENDSTGLLTPTLAERVECYLSAHFYAHADQIPQTKSTGGASASFQGQSQMVLSSTQFGQTAMLLDPTGLLQKRCKEVQEGGRRMTKSMWLGSSRF
jgi:hypothetical protein